MRVYRGKRAGGDFQERYRWISRRSAKLVLEQQVD